MDRIQTSTAIIGNGLQGMGVGINLAAQDDRDFRLIGPGSPLAAWKRVVGRQGMTHLRSRTPQYLSDPQDRSWKPKDYADQEGVSFQDELEGGDRLSCRLMDAFHLSLLDRAGIRDNLMDGLATRMEVREDGGFDTVVKGSDGQEVCVQSKKAVLALGLGEPRMPEISGIDAPGVCHSHDLDVRRDWQGQEVLLVGSGQTAWTLANGILQRGGRVHLTSRGEPEVHRLDFDPAYFNGVLLDQFKGKDLEARIQEIEAQHARGRVHPMTHEAVLSHDDRFVLHTGTQLEDLRQRGDRVESDIGIFDTVVLCTGYRFDARKIRWAAPVLGHVSTHLGFPEVSPETLEVNGVPGLYVVGRAASLGHGPAASNFGMCDVNAYVVSSAINPDRKLPFVERKVA